MIDLNAAEEFAKIDKEDMLGHVVELGQTCADAWELAQRIYPQLDIPDSLRQARQIVVVGMGGSAIGGDLLAALVADECARPVIVQRGYSLPAFVDGPETLVIGVSYSGNTEETLSAFTQAHERGASLLAMTTDGEIARRAAEWSVPAFRFQYEAQPRAALGYSFIPLVNLLCYLGFISEKADDLAEAVQVMRRWQDEIGPRSPVEENPAKQMALALVGRVPVVYGAGLMAPVARRWKTQLNENAKVWSFFEELPELNHNAVVGYEQSAMVRERMTVILVRSRFDSPRIGTRYRVTREMLRQEEVRSEQVEARGTSRLAQMLSAIQFGDLVSVYLALASGVDPTPVAPIAYLKKQLSQA